MQTELSKEQFVKILRDEEITKKEDLDIFQAIYSFQGHKAYASQVAQILGKTHHSPLNSQIGRLAKRIDQKYDISEILGSLAHRNHGRIRYWSLFFDGRYEKTFFVWQLKENLKQALEETGRTGESKFANAKIFAEEIPTEYSERYPEGAKKTVIVNAYERNNIARQKCIAGHGVICKVCEFNFEMEYGELGKGFIHVHHLTPVSEIGETYEVDPIKDLAPVCPNCHAMIHRATKTLTIEELKNLYNNAKARTKNYRK